MEDILSRLSAMINNAENAPDPLADTIGADDSDQEVALLKALKPYLSRLRGEKVEESIRLLKLMKLIPMLKNGGDEG